MTDEAPLSEDRLREIETFGNFLIASVRNGELSFDRQSVAETLTKVHDKWLEAERRNARLRGLFREEDARLCETHAILDEETVGIMGGSGYISKWRDLARRIREALSQ